MSLLAAAAGSTYGSRKALLKRKEEAALTPVTEIFSPVRYLTLVRLSYTLTNYANKRRFHT